MPDTERIQRLNQLLRRRQGATMRELIEVLEVSRATVNRDIGYMRDRLNAPIRWNREENSYRIIEAEQDVGPQFQVPGMWLTPAQAYAYLTLNNMVEKLAPKLLESFIDPMRTTLKQVLCDVQFPMFGLDRKIEITMPMMPKLGERQFADLMKALIDETPVHIELRDGGSADGVPEKLSISANGWNLQLFTRRTEREAVDVSSIVGVVALEDEAPTRS